MIRVKRLLQIFVASILLFSLPLESARAQSPISSAEMIEATRDNYIFVFDGSVPSNSARDWARSLVGQAGGDLGHVYANSIKGFSARMPAKAAARIAGSNPLIAYFEKDQIAFPFPPPWCRDNPDDPRCGGDGGDGGDGGSSDPTQEIPWGVTRVGGAAAPTGRAFVIDGGVDLDHPDLNVNVSLSRDFVSRGKNNGGDDPDGHGTHVAGTIGAKDNSRGVIGVAPGAEIISVRVLGRNGGTYADVIAGVDYVGAQGVMGDVANMSLGGGYSQALNDAVIAASGGAAFVLAAGNESDDAAKYSPASAEGANIYSVSASDINDAFASFSNYGNPPIECAAPGVGVLSTYRDGGYATLSGTSMAAPHVAGLVISGGAFFKGSVSGDPDTDADPFCSR
jgi:subtilisin family serine protease